MTENDKRYFSVLDFITLRYGCPHETGEIECGNRMDCLKWEFYYDPIECWDLYFQKRLAEKRKNL